MRKALYEYGERKMGKKRNWIPENITQIIRVITRTILKKLRFLKKVY